jgi:hypothetical protein
MGFESTTLLAAANWAPVVFVIGSACRHNEAVLHDRLAVTRHARYSPTARATNTFRQDIPPSVSIRARRCACTRGGSPWSPYLIPSLSRRGRVAAGVQGSGSGQGP